MWVGFENIDFDYELTVPKEMVQDEEEDVSMDEVSSDTPNALKTAYEWVKSIVPMYWIAGIGMIVIFLLALWLTGIKLDKPEISPREQAVIRLNELNMQDLPDIEIRNNGIKAQSRIDSRQAEKVQLMSKI